MRHRYHGTVRSNPLRGDLTQCWTQPPSSNIGLWIIGALWSAKMHLESLYVTCLCVTPVSRSTGLMYKPDEKEKCVATNARHPANGIKWPGGEQKGYWAMESYRWQHRGPRIRRQQHLVFHIHNPDSASGAAFCETAGHMAPTVQTAPPWTTMQLPGTGRSWRLPPTRVYSFPYAYGVPGQDPIPALFFQQPVAQGETLGGVFSILHSL